VAEVQVTREDILVPFGVSLVSVSVRRHCPPSPKGKVFCFHGFTGRAEDFGELAGFLAANGFDVLAPDMVGRGESGVFADPRDYSFQNMLKVVTAIIDYFLDGKPRTLIGVGWGGLLALVVSAGRSAQHFERVIAAEVPARYAIEDDAIISDAIARANMTFPTLEAGLQGLLQSPEFVGMALAEMRSRIYRLRERDGNYFFHYDKAIVARQADHHSKVYTIAALVPPDGSRLLVRGSAGTTTPLDAGLDLITFAQPYARLDSHAEHLLVLGFLTAIVS